MRTLAVLAALLFAGCFDGSCPPKHNDAFDAPALYDALDGAAGLIERAPLSKGLPFTDAAGVPPPPRSLVGVEFRTDRTQLAILPLETPDATRAYLGMIGADDAGARADLEAFAAALGVTDQSGAWWDALHAGGGPRLARGGVGYQKSARIDDTTIDTAAALRAHAADGNSSWASPGLFHLQQGNWTFDFEVATRSLEGSFNGTRVRVNADARGVVDATGFTNQADLEVWVAPKLAGSSPPITNFRDSVIVC